MFKVIKDGSTLCTEDYAKYARLQSNGVYAICSEEEADSVIANDEIHPLSTVQLVEFAGAAELAETQGEFESLLSDTRNNLVSIPVQGAEWSAEMRYIAGDTVEGGYIALKYNRNKPPAANLGTYWAVQTVTYPAWSDIEDGTVIEVDAIVTYNGKTWRCTEQHIKSTVYKPKAGSSKWSEYTD